MACSSAVKTAATARTTIFVPTKQTNKQTNKHKHKHKIEIKLNIGANFNNQLLSKDDYLAYG